VLVCNVLHVVHDYNSLLIQKTKVIYGELAMDVQQSLHSAEQPVVSLTLPVWAGPGKLEGCRVPIPNAEVT